MALTGNALIADALFRHLATLTTSPATVVAWPGNSFDGTDASNRPYLQPQFVPNTTRENTFDTIKDFQGFLSVTVIGDKVYTSGGVHLMTLQNMASQVVAHFPTTLKLYTTEHVISFRQPGSVSQALPDGSDWRVPVSIPYYATTA